MSNLLVIYSSCDGHTAEIAAYITNELKAHNHHVEMCDAAQFTAPSLEGFDGIIAGGPIHRGRHSRHLSRFVHRYRRDMQEMPSAFFSVSLSAAGTDSQKIDARRCMTKFLRDVAWHPSMTTIVAGALSYLRYGIFKRWLMKTIAKRVGGDTDTSKNHVYTDWDQLQEFVERFVHAHVCQAAVSPQTIDRAVPRDSCTG